MRSAITLDAMLASLSRTRGRAAQLMLAAAALSAVACSRRFDVPEPQVGARVVLSLSPAEPATIAIPVSVAMSTLRTRLDSLFPASDSLDRATCSSLGGFVCHQYVYRRDSVELKMIGDRITLFTRLRFRGRVALPGVGGIASCGYDPEPMRRAELRLATSLYWRTDWRLASRSTVISADILDRCTVTVLRVDATPTMQRLIDGQLARVERQLDSIIPAVADLQPAADSLWRVMQRPIALDSASTVWLTLSPEHVSLGPLTGAGSTATTALVLTARPRVVVGGKPEEVAAPLPSLSLSAAQGGVHVPLEIEVPFADLSRRVTALLAGEVAGKDLDIRAITVWGVGDTAVVKVGIGGRLRGDLFLVGRVGYDSAARAVLISDLQYTIASADKISSIKSTLGAIRIRRALADATGHGRLAIGEQLDRATVQLNAALNRELAPGVALSGGVMRVRIASLSTTESAFVLRVVLDGDARIDVR
ncbi:MAG TPA: DUF4403 family protein [Gemmatimonadaceae bacterium]|jgi:hypothetical protein|nr:DUF4403 family protein [Gemmatimonadaceae bacterium]